MNPEKMDSGKLEESKLTIHGAPWDRNANVIWLASTLALHRNLEKFTFPQKLDVERKNQLASIITKAILSIEELQHPFVVAAKTLTQFDKNFLQEHFLMLGALQEAHQGESCVLDDTGSFIALLNIKDHLFMQLTDVEGDLEKNLIRLQKIENKLSANLSFAFSQKFGFLTADPLLSGTGLVVTAYLHLPALIHLNMLTDLLEKEKNDALLCSGMQGAPDDLIGDILTIRNAFTTAINEENIIATMRSAILKLVIAEKDARSKILAAGTAVIKDLVSRALGVLKFSYTIDTSEALSMISLLTLGVELGWVKGLTVQEVNNLFFTCRRAHMSYALKEKIAHEAMATKRGDFLRHALQAVECVFQS